MILPQTIGSEVQTQGQKIGLKRMYGDKELSSGNGFGNGMSKGVTARRGNVMWFRSKAGDMYESTERGESCRR
jgi:hypothetical protein